MDQYKTPGVYIVEENAFPNSVVEVPSAIPVFIGQTQTAKSGARDLTSVPTKVTSPGEYDALFGGPPSLIVDQTQPDATMTCDNPFLMYHAIQFYFENGGGDCYVISTGPYLDKDGKKIAPTPAAVADALIPLADVAEVTMVLTPDAARMSLTDWSTVTKAVLHHCQRLQSRIAILDLVKGDQPVVDDGPIADFYNNVGTQGLSYGAAYYPWLNTNLTAASDVTFLNLTDNLRAAIQTEVAAKVAGHPNLEALVTQITTVTTQDAAKKTHAALMQVSATYKARLDSALAAINVMPPSAGIAGLICQTDNTIGPWKAPANASLTCVLSPTADITSEQGEALNVPLNGLAINAIRSFVNRGVLVWGARTLDGNSQDWRYISVRRTLIMIEQSAKMACESFVFEPNDANTWTTVKAMLENFLTNMWKQGALAGSKPADAFSVDVGLGSTMTSQDILNGYMNVTIKVAVTHPAEFIVLSFRQQMSTSS